MLYKYIHKSVLLNEVVKNLNIHPDGVYLDGTFGHGGHSRLILSKLGKKGKLFAIDRDITAIKFAKTIKDKRFTIIHGLFSNMLYYIMKNGLLEKINGILLDLGMSSFQIDNPDRGFSFMHDGPLDMRMNNMVGQTASTWLRKASVKEITFVLKNFGEERFSNIIAKAIVEKNKKMPILRTKELANLISRITFNKSKHPATRSFQAIRVFINNELQEIKKTLNNVLKILIPEGRLLIITFHSIEEKIVKNFINNNDFNNFKLKHNLPITEKQMIKLHNNNKFKLKLIKEIYPSITEISYNPRSRSATLICAEKTFI